MEDGATAAKRAKRLSYSDASSDYESIMNTDSEMTSDDNSTFAWLSSVRSKVHKPLVLKVPRSYTRVPQKLQKPDHSSEEPVSEKRKRNSLLTKAQFDALDGMSLDSICVWADMIPEFKEMARKFFAVKYRHINLSLLANPQTGKYSLDKVARMLRIFGHLIWSLAMDINKLDDPDSVTDLLALVRNHCSQTLGWMVL